ALPSRRAASAALAAPGGEVEVRDRPHSRRGIGPSLRVVPAPLWAQADAVLRCARGRADLPRVPGRRLRADRAFRVPARQPGVSLSGIAARSRRADAP